MTIVEWVDLFTRHEYKDISVNNLKHCQTKRALPEVSQDRSTLTLGTLQAIDFALQSPSPRLTSALTLGYFLKLAHITFRF